MHVNIVISTKSGVGEPFIAMTLADYLNSSGRRCLTLDLAPSGWSHLSAVSALNVMTAPVVPDLPPSPSQEPARKAQLASALSKLEGGENPTAVVLCEAKYYRQAIKLFENEGTAKRITDAGNTLIIHVIVGDTGHTERCLKGLDELAQVFPSPVRFVVWLNQELQHYTRAEFEQTPQYARHHERITHIVEVPLVRNKAHLHNLGLMRSRNRTFSESIARRYAIMASVKEATARGDTSGTEVLELNSVDKVYQELKPRLPPLEIIAG